MKNKKIFLFGTAGFGGEPSYFERILHKVKENIDNTNVVVGSYMCQGKMPISVRKRYEALLLNNPEDTKYKLLIANYDQALSHPDS